MRRYGRDQIVCELDSESPLREGIVTFGDLAQVLAESEIGSHAAA